MKTIALLALLIHSLPALAQTGYTVTPNRWGLPEVRLTGVTNDLFATHRLEDSRGPGWRRAAEAMIEDESVTDAIEVMGKIEDGTVTESCGLNFESVEYVEADSLSYKWAAMKPIRGTKTVLYVVDTYGDYVVTKTNGKKVSCPYLIQSFVFLNQAEGRNPFKLLGQLVQR